MTGNIDSSTADRGLSPRNVMSVAAELAASVKQFNLTPGFYAVTIGDGGDHRSTVEGLALPITHLQLLGAKADTDVFATGSSPGWAGPQGGTIVVRIGHPHGRILLTTYRPVDQAPIPLSIQVAPLGRPASLDETSHPSDGTVFADAPPAQPEPLLSVTLACRDEDEMSVEGGAWAGAPGEGRLIEAFAVKLPDETGVGDIEYKAFGPNGLETPWVRGARLCGSRGRGVSLTGFAVRLSTELSEQFDVVYQGSFTGSGETSEHRNGEACLNLHPDDLLEGLKVRLQPRS